MLETGEFIRVGASRAQKIDVRVVGATNVGMLEAIKKGKFREDLYYRLTRNSAAPESALQTSIYCLESSRFCNKHHLPPLRLDDEAVRLLSNTAGLETFVSCAIWRSR